MALPLDKKKKPQPIKTEEPPIIVKEKPSEELIKNLPVIQDLNIKVVALAEAFSGSLTEVNKKFEGYDVQARDTNEKITTLGQAVSILNNEFSKLVGTLQAKFATIPASPGENTPPGTSVVSSERVSLEKPPVAESPPPSTGDKLYQWANLLASLAGSGQPSGGGGSGVGATDLLKLVLELQDKAEERALKRQETSVKSIAMIANLLTGKRKEILEEITKPETTEHLT